VGPALAKVTPPEQALPPARLILTIIRNPIEAWPKPVYEQLVYRSRAFGRQTVFITEPDLIQEVLVEKADAFVKAQSLQRALSPALGDGILTADGARWRWQRRATAPIFRHERIKSSSRRCGGTKVSNLSAAGGSSWELFGRKCLKIQGPGRGMVPRGGIVPPHRDFQSSQTRPHASAGVHHDFHRSL
jgi:hypothetical protein